MPETLAVCNVHGDLASEGGGEEIEATFSDRSSIHQLESPPETAPL